MFRFFAEIKMKNNTNIYRLLIFFVAILFSLGAKAQNPTDTLPGDPGAIYVYTIQNLHFGAIALGPGLSTVTVLNNGNRQSTGNAILISGGNAFYQAIVDVEAAQGSLISITNGADVSLNGSNGGTITLSIGDSSPGSPFNVTVAPPVRTPVHIGGTIRIPPNTLVGVYSGTFYVTFNQE